MFRSTPPRELIDPDAVPIADWNVEERVSGVDWDEECWETTLSFQELENRIRVAKLQKEGPQDEDSYCDYLSNEEASET